jgi:branched-chain amino acid transport system ATP-binding protein
MSELVVTNLYAGYGQLSVLEDVSVSLAANEILGILGPNGAGKTTLMRVLSGLINPERGTVRYRGEDITTLSTSDRVQRGLSLVPEDKKLFPSMTVKENLVMGLYSSGRDDRDARLQRVYDLFPRLEERTEQAASTLSGGEAQMLTIGRALMSEPETLLLDEPSSGLAPNLVPQVFDTLVDVNERFEVSLIVVEQNVHQVLEFADAACLLEDGRIGEKRAAAEMQRDDRVVEKYLGGGTR